MAERAQRDAERKSFSEEASSLWLITLAPTLWALHFVMCYCVTAVVCEKFANLPDAVPMLRLGIGALTVIALALIAYVGWRSWEQWDYLDDYDYSHDKAIAEHRHEFLGHASFLLAIISFIGVLYVSMPAIVLEACR